MRPWPCHDLQPPVEPKPSSTQRTNSSQKSANPVISSAVVNGDADSPERERIPRISPLLSQSETATK